jgi:hypothetical protein
MINVFLWNDNLNGSWNKEKKREWDRSIYGKVYKRMNSKGKHQVMYLPNRKTVHLVPFLGGCIWRWRTIMLQLG